MRISDVKLNSLGMRADKFVFNDIATIDPHEVIINPIITGGGPYELFLTTKNNSFPEIMIINPNFAWLIQNGLVLNGLELKGSFNYIKDTNNVPWLIPINHPAAIEAKRISMWKKPKLTIKRKYTIGIRIPKPKEPWELPGDFFCMVFNIKTGDRISSIDPELPVCEQISDDWITKEQVEFIEKLRVGKYVEMIYLGKLKGVVDIVKNGNKVCFMNNGTDLTKKMEMAVLQNPDSGEIIATKANNVVLIKDNGPTKNARGLNSVCLEWLENSVNEVINEHEFPGVTFSSFIPKKDTAKQFIDIKKLASLYPNIEFTFAKDV